MQECIFVGMGGFIGSVCRYLIGLIPLGESTAFPLKTLLINIVGAFFAGALASLAERNVALDPRLLLLLKVGVCGGFTTFSTFACETGGLLGGGHAALGALYALLSMALGVLAALAGCFVVKRAAL